MTSPHPESGSAAVEFAVLFLLLLIVMFGIIDLGIIWLQSHYIANAAREGARVASKISDLSDGAEQTKVETAIKTYLRGVYRDLQDSEVHLSYDSPAPPAPKFVEIALADGTLNDFTGAGLASPPAAVEVRVTVQTAAIWAPVLWDLLKLLPGENPLGIKEISQLAVFTKQPE